MRFSIEGREYEFDSTLTVEEAMNLEDKSGGLGMNEIDQALFKGKARAVAAWMFILKRRAGEAVRWQDMLKLDILTFRIIPDEITAAPDEGESPDAPSEAAPDPTQPTGKPRKRVTSST
jgi:hypothetical protein